MVRSVALMICFLAWTGTSAFAQGHALKSSEGRGVFVIDQDRREWQGRLLRVSADAIELESDAGVRTFSLDAIRRVDADSDNVWDGAMKGAAIGGVLALIFVSAANESSAAPFLSNALTFGLVGLAVDAGCSARHPVYHGTAAPKLDPAGESAAVRVSMRVRW